MAVTQSAFERTLQERLDNEGFELTKKDVQELLDIVGSTVEACLRNDTKAAKANGGGNPSVIVRGMGKFTIRTYKARMGRNPQTGEQMKIKASKRLRVTPPKALRDALKVK